MVKRFQAKRNQTFKKLEQKYGETSLEQLSFSERKNSAAKSTKNSAKMIPSASLSMRFKRAVTPGNESKLKAIEKVE